MEYLDDKAFLIAFGKNLRKLRKEKGYTQEELANELDIEISQISRIERGIINTSIVNANSIASVLKIKITELFDLL
ncbi:helix-turn-helix domain-containing protein [Costertonia aggregata]|uniref:Helix-turn-helix transcriptional regulator n=1 Tax=Costertonia aggregata TaxID=343403 RepID=A0A7H9APR4_9FLAO|nr:helix-turn-helix transcriptional regulator [Costertonia aggregata]QLG45404.1 helix-turn-helix transcriptional regulator [Costertonia aggregata]